MFFFCHLCITISILWNQRKWNSVIPQKYIILRFGIPKSFAKIYLEDHSRTCKCLGPPPFVSHEVVVSRTYVTSWEPILHLDPTSRSGQSWWNCCRTCFGNQIWVKFIAVPVPAGWEFPPNWGDLVGESFLPQKTPKNSGIGITPTKFHSEFTPKKLPGPERKGSSTLVPSFFRCYVS